MRIKAAMAVAVAMISSSAAHAEPAYDQFTGHSYWPAQALYSDSSGYDVSARPDVRGAGFSVVRSGATTFLALQGDAKASPSLNLAAGLHRDFAGTSSVLRLEMIAMAGAGMLRDRGDYSSTRRACDGSEEGCVTESDSNIWNFESRYVRASAQANALYIRNAMTIGLVMRVTSLSGDFDYTHHYQPFEGLNNSTDNSGHARFEGLTLVEPILVGRGAISPHAYLEAQAGFSGHVKFPDLQGRDALITAVGIGWHF